MADVNHVTLIGRCSRDMELKFTGGGMAIGNLSIAVNKRRKKGDEWVEETSFFEIALFGKTAEGLKPYLLKGKQIAVEGELHQDRWEQEGQSRSKVVIHSSNIQLLGGNDKQGAGNTGGGYTPKQSSKYVQNDEAAGGEFPEDIPF